MRKIIIGILSLFIIFFIDGCSNKSNYSSDLYDIKIALDLANEFMQDIAEGDIDKANGLMRNTTISSDESNKLQEHKIISYKMDEVTEGSDYSYIRYLVVRGNDTDVEAALDKIELKVVMNSDDKEYRIEQVNAKGIKEVYEDSNNLRIRDEEIGKSNLLLRKKDLPTEVFKKSDEVALTKDEIDGGNFGKVNIGFNGSSVALSLNGENKTLVALATVDESEAVDGEAEGSSSEINVDDESQAIGEQLEKPIAKSIIGYDLIQNAEVQKLLFTEDDGGLIVQYKEEGKGSALKIYQNPTGDLGDMNIEQLFPSDVYSVTVTKITKAGTYINVSAISEENAEEGEYIIDFKSMSITKE